MLQNALLNLGVSSTVDNFSKRNVTATRNGDKRYNKPSHTLTTAVPSVHRLGALIRKNFLLTFRNIG